jgi:hypothetical protein
MCYNANVTRFDNQTHRSDFVYKLYGSFQQVKNCEYKSVVM